MRVVVAKTAGYCWGVRRTVDKVLQAAERGGPVFTLGPVIHNPQAVAQMKGRGVAVAGSLADVPDGATVVVRTHGAVKGELERARAREDVTLVDGTCPYVVFPQAMARRLSREGYHVVVVGDPGHAEVQGVVSYAEGPCTVVRPGEPIPEISARKVAVLAQTTLVGAELERVVGALALRHREVRAVNTICDDTDERQAEARALAAGVDAVVVVGGRGSANTRHLAEICREIQPRTWHVETADELEPGWFEGCRVAGVSAGASTPDWVVEGVVGWLSAQP